MNIPLHIATTQVAVNAAAVTSSRGGAVPWWLIPACLAIGALIWLWLNYEWKRTWGE